MNNFGGGRRSLILAVINIGFTGAVAITVVYIEIIGSDIKVALLEQRLLLLLFILESLALKSKLCSCFVHIISRVMFGKEWLGSVQRYTLLRNTRNVRIYTCKY